MHIYISAYVCVFWFRGDNVFFFMSSIYISIQQTFQRFVREDFLSIPCFPLQIKKQITYIYLYIYIYHNSSSYFHFFFLKPVYLTQKHTRILAYVHITISQAQLKSCRSNINRHFQVQARACTHTQRPPTHTRTHAYNCVYIY